MTAAYLRCGRIVKRHWSYYPCGRVFLSSEVAGFGLRYCPRCNAELLARYDAEQSRRAAEYAKQMEAK